MSLRVAVAAPFAQRGTRELPENEFVVALSLDRGWFTPDQATQLSQIATDRGLLERDDGDALAVTFDPREVTIPEDFEPDADLLRERSPFERVLEAVVDAGIEKREAVGSINALQQELGVTVEAAAIVYACRAEVAVDGLGPIAREALVPEPAPADD